MADIERATRHYDKAKNDGNAQRWGNMMGEISMIELQKQYGGEYVALRGDEVVAHGQGYDKMAEVLDATGIARTQVVIAFIPSPDIIHIPSVYNVCMVSEYAP